MVIFLIGLNIVSFVVIIYQYRRMNSLIKMLIFIRKRNRVSRFLISSVLKISDVDDYLGNKHLFTKDEMIKIEALRYVEDYLLSDAVNSYSKDIDTKKLHPFVRSYLPEINNIIEKSN